MKWFKRKPTTSYIGHLVAISNFVWNGHTGENKAIAQAIEQVFDNSNSFFI